MKRVKVLVPFHMIATDTDHIPGDIISVSDAQLAKIKAVNVNMVAVLGDAEETEQPKKTRNKGPHMSDLNYHKGMTVPLSLPMCVPAWSALGHLTLLRSSL